jgi:prepilin-type N-terminal cleavage/methylation domain-containing protein
MKSPHPGQPHGFTLVEVLVAMALTGIVVAGTLQALSAQKKFYARQARILDARHALRASTTILSAELRETSSGGQDLYAIAPDSVALRSTLGFGIVCSVSGGSLSLTHVSGHFRSEAGDSVLVFVENSVNNGDDAWRVLPVTALSVSGSDCPSGAAVERVVSVSGDLSGVWVGAPVRLFRPYVYGQFEMDGSGWLGRRNRTAGFTYIPVAGPLAPPGQDGLRFTYFRQDGTTTLNAAEVVRVDIEVRAPTFRTLDDPDYRNLGTSVYLRNNG